MVSSGPVIMKTISNLLSANVLYVSAAGGEAQSYAVVQSLDKVGKCLSEGLMAKTQTTTLPRFHTLPKGGAYSQVIDGLHNLTASTLSPGESAVEVTTSQISMKVRI